MGIDFHVGRRHYWSFHIPTPAVVLLITLTALFGVWMLGRFVVAAIPN